MDAARRQAAAALAVVASAALLVLKLGIGLVGGSVALVAAAAHSGVSLVATVTALLAVSPAAGPVLGGSVARRPDSGQAGQPEAGPERIQGTASTIEALVIFLAAAWIIYEAVKKLMRPGPVDAVGWGVGIMLVSAVVNLLMAQRLRRAGRGTPAVARASAATPAVASASAAVGAASPSVALQTGASHLRADAYASAGVVAALTLITLGEGVLPAPGLGIADPIAAIAVALSALWGAWRVVAVSRDAASGT